MAIVNLAFAKQFFKGENPVGKWFENQHVRFQIVGFAGDARSRDDMRRPIFPTALRSRAMEINLAHTVRERLPAMLAMFFAGVAVLLAGIGLYGVLDYGVLQQRCEIGIRMAIGAQAGDIARRVTSEAF